MLILAFSSGLKQGLQGLGVLGHIDRVGGGHLAAAQAVIEDVGVHVPVVGVVVIGVIGQDKGEGENLNIDLPDQVGGQVGGGVGEDNKI